MLYSIGSHSVECYSVDKVEYIRNMTYGVLLHVEYDPWGNLARKEGK